MMKNAFYFILKAFFILKIFKFLSWLFGHVEKKDLFKKITITILCYPTSHEEKQPDNKIQSINKI